MSSLHRYVVIISTFFVGISFAKIKMKVSHGTEDIHGEFPFAVTLNYGMERHCTGSLISDQWVLTAAHCVVPDNIDEGPPDRIRYKDFTMRKKTKSFSKIIGYFVYPSFSLYQEGNRNDIALVKVQKVSVNNTGRLSSVDWKALMGAPVKYAGFGCVDRGDVFCLTDEEFDVRPLQVGQGLVVPCEPEYSFYYRITEMCIASRCVNREESIHGGDSGGPATYRGRIIGVACSSDDNEPIVLYTPVSPYLEWILKTIDDHS